VEEFGTSRRREASRRRRSPFSISSRITGRTEYVLPTLVEVAKFRLEPTTGSQTTHLTAVPSSSVSRLRSSKVGRMSY
jgi:hypothetical protein